MTDREGKERHDKHPRPLGTLLLLGYRLVLSINAFTTLKDKYGLYNVHVEAAVECPLEWGPAY